MGLDSYIYTASKDLANAFAEYIEISSGDDFLANLARTRGVIGYWRKFSALHDWMVQNIQGGDDDCGKYELDYDDLVALREKVKRAIIKHDMDIFPPSTGFFFNPVDYEDWHWNNMQNLLNFLDFLFMNVENRKGNVHFIGDEWDARIEYQASW